MNILQKIFIDYYEEIKYSLHPRASELDNIEKMINCGDPSFGGAMYICPDCHNMKFVPFRCHSRFCPTCGVKYSQERSASMSFKLVNCIHRHCVFTIDEELRLFFLKDRSLLNCLFQAVRSVIFRMFYKMNKSQNFVPGFICVLHTFGRPLEWNPHIHCLLSEGGYSDKGFWRPVKHFNYTYLRLPGLWSSDPVLAPCIQQKHKIILGQYIYIFVSYTFLWSYHSIFIQIHYFSFYLRRCIFRKCPYDCIHTCFSFEYIR